MNPWAVHNWLTKLDIKSILVENVPEFVEWGPLNSDGRPDKAHKGEHFQAWFLTFHALGYQAEWRMLNAADYGDATTRIRFFLMARKDGKPVVWPEPSHAKGDTGMFPGRLPWRGAREIIDWSNPGRSLLDDPKYQKKPLSEKTRRRIARGLERFGGALSPLYIRLLDLPDEGTPETVPNAQAEVFILNHHGESGQGQSHSIQRPAPTVDTPGAGDLVEPAAKPFVYGQQSQGAPRLTESPIPTITTDGVISLVLPTIEGLQEKAFMLGQHSGNAPRSTENPTPTIMSDGGISLVRPLAVEYYDKTNAKEIDRPLSRVMPVNHHGLASPILVEYYGKGNGADIDLPVPTLTTKDRHGLANPLLIDVNHGYTPKGETGDGNRSQSVEGPLGTVTTKRGIGLVNPTVVEVNHGNGQDGNKGNDRRVHSVDEPLGSITTVPGLGLAEPILAQASQADGNGGYSRPVADPTPEVQAYIVANFGERNGQDPRVHSIDNPTPTVTSRGAGSLVLPSLEQLESAQIDPRRVVVLNGHPFLLDIRFRMLQNTELARAMGFDDEETTYEFVGNIGEVTKQIGNAVPVNLAEALVRAILEER